MSWNQMWGRLDQMQPTGAVTSGDKQVQFQPRLAQRLTSSTRPSAVSGAPAVNPCGAPIELLLAALEPEHDLVDVFWISRGRKWET